MPQVKLRGTRKNFPRRLKQNWQKDREIGYLESQTWQWIEPDPPGCNTTAHLCPWAHLEIKLPHARIHSTPETHRWVHFVSISPEATGTQQPIASSAFSQPLSLAFSSSSHHSSKAPEELRSDLYYNQRKRRNKPLSFLLKNPQEQEKNTHTRQSSETALPGFPFQNSCGGAGRAPSSSWDGPGRGGAQAGCGLPTGHACCPGALTPGGLTTIAVSRGQPGESPEAFEPPPEVTQPPPPLHSWAHI